MFNRKFTILTDRSAMYKLASFQMELINRSVRIVYVLMSHTSLPAPPKKKPFHKAYVTTKKPAGRDETGEAKDNRSPPISSLRFLYACQKVSH